MEDITNLKIRVIPTILVDNYQVVKSKQFLDHRIFGNLLQTVELFSKRNVDELVIMDIAASKNNSPIDSRILKIMTANSLMPITYGGGIKTLKDIEICLNTGCEKIILNSNLFKDKKILESATNEFGSQSVIVCIDIKKENSNYGVYNHTSNKIEKINLISYLDHCQNSGCGEIVINSVDNDGELNGYDLKLLEYLRPKIKRPLIISGGCGSPKDMDSAIKIGSDACMAGSMFYFTKYSYRDIKEFLLKENNCIRA